MGMLEGKVVGEVMAIKIAEIGAQGEERTFTIVSMDESGNVPTCNGSCGYRCGDAPAAHIRADGVADGAATYLVLPCLRLYARGLLFAARLALHLRFQGRPSIAMVPA